MAKSPEQIREELVDMCVDIFAHANNDFEITLSGNGTNASEACNVANSVLSTLGIEYEEIEAKVDERTKELADDYGY